MGEMDLVLFRFRSGILVVLEVSRIIPLIIFVKIYIWQSNDCFLFNLFSAAMKPQTIKLKLISERR